MFSHEPAGEFAVVTREMVEAIVSPTSFLLLPEDAGEPTGCVPAGWRHGKRNGRTADDIFKMVYFMFV